MITCSHRKSPISSGEVRFVVVQRGQEHRLLGGGAPRGSHPCDHQHGQQKHGPQGNIILTFHFKLVTSFHTKAQTMKKPKNFHVL